ncbi:plasmid recombination protein, partial [Hydrogenimonas sp.]
MANSCSVILRSRKTKAPNAGNLVHNAGLKSANYWLDYKPDLMQLEKIKSTKEANEKWRAWIEAIEENYKKNKERKLRSDAVRIEEGLIVVGKDVVGRENSEKLRALVENFISLFQKKYNTGVLHWAIHDHEGVSEVDKNIHVHFLFSNFGFDGNNVRNEMTKYELSKLQDMIFEAAQPVFEGVKRATNYAKMGLR